MQDTPWKYSDAQDNTQIPPTEGPRYLRILDVRHEPEGRFGETYKLTMQDLETSAEFDLNYYMTETDNFGNILPNRRARGTLLTLKKALYGPLVDGIPNPVDIKGCIVLGTISLKVKDNGVSYPRCFVFGPVPQDLVYLSSHMDQYCIPDETQPQAGAVAETEAVAEEDE